jgi:citrate synthase
MHITTEVKMDPVLFQITEENLETGLRGYPVGYCPTSHVDPITGLFYAEKSVSALSFESPEKVIYLLVNGKEGTDKEVEEFNKKLTERSRCSSDLIQSIKALPGKGHPMQLFIASLILAGIAEGKDDYREDCLNVIAKMPEVAATVINHHAGWGGCNPSKPELGYMENFTQMLKVPNADNKKLNSIFRIFNVLHYDHGGGNLSTFIGKAVSSGLQDMYGSLAAAMSALAGPRHGKANQDCLDFVKEVLCEVGEKATAADVEGFIRKRLANNQLVFGFGHAVLRVEDPRATVRNCPKRLP